LILGNEVGLRQPIVGGIRESQDPPVNGRNRRGLPDLRKNGGHEAQLK
jgi:hypothetical protein